MKLLRIDMATATVSIQDVPEALADLGGRALTSLMINAEVPADCDPLGQDNKLIFAPGYFSATPLVNTSRLSIGAKSPLTGGVKESNVGGTMARDLAQHGIAAVVAEERPETGSSFILKIDANGDTVLEKAGKLRDTRTYQMVKQIRNLYGPDYSITGIGPA